MRNTLSKNKVKLHTDKVKTFSSNFDVIKSVEN